MDNNQPHLNNAGDVASPYFLLTRSGAIEVQTLEDLADELAPRFEEDCCAVAVRPLTELERDALSILVFDRIADGA